MALIYVVARQDGTVFVTRPELPYPFSKSFEDARLFTDPCQALLCAAISDAEVRMVCAPCVGTGRFSAPNPARPVEPNARLWFQCPDCRGKGVTPVHPPIPKEA